MKLMPYKGIFYLLRDYSTFYRFLIVIHVIELESDFDTVTVGFTKQILEDFRNKEKMNYGFTDK